MYPLNSLFHDKLEDRLTVLLAELIEDSRFSDGLHGLLFGLGRASRLEGPWATQSHVGIENGVVDLLLEGKALTSIVEVKIGADFTKGQPQNYAKYLAKVRNSTKREVTLVLLVPRILKDYYQEEAALRLKKAALDDVSLATITWEEVTDMCDSILAYVDQQHQPFVAGLSNLIRTKIGLTPGPLTDEEAFILRSIPATRAVSYVVNILDPLMQQLAEAIKIDQTTAGNGFAWCGKNFYCKKHSYWIGVWIDLWAAQGKGPLWVQSPGRKAEIPAITARELEISEYANAWVVPLTLSPIIGINEQIKRLVKKVVRFVQLDLNAG